MVKEIENYIISFGFKKIDNNRFETEYKDREYQYTINISSTGSFTLGLIDHADLSKFSKTYIFKGYSVKKIEDIEYLLNNTVMLSAFQKPQ